MAAGDSEGGRRSPLAQLEGAFLPGCLNFILFHKATAVIAFAAVTAALTLANHLCYEITGTANAW